MNHKVINLWPFLDVVDKYLQHEPVHGFSPAWKSFHRAAMESMDHLKKILMYPPGPMPVPPCLWYPEWDGLANVVLRNRIPPKAVFKKEIKIAKPKKLK